VVQVFFASVLGLFCLCIGSLLTLLTFIIPYVVQNFVHTKIWEEGNPDVIAMDTVQWSYYLVTGTVTHTHTHTLCHTLMCVHTC